MLDERLAAKRAGDFDSKRFSLVNQTGSLHNFYDAWWSKGANACAAALELPLIPLLCEGDFSRYGYKEIVDTISKTKGNMVLNTTAPPSMEELKQLIDLCERHKIYFVTNNNLPRSDSRPWNFSPYYVAHIEFDHRLAGFKAAQELIAVIGGKGGIVAFQGKDFAASQRFKGLNDALAAAARNRRMSSAGDAENDAPHCFILADTADADWEASAAFDIMRGLIAELGLDNIAGVWAANDEMALGAIEALRLHKRSIPVTGIDGTPDALSAIQSGVMTATVAWDAFWQGGIGLSLAASARTGLFAPSEQPHSHRAFYAPFWVVTADNAATFLEYRHAEHPVVDWKDFWGRSTGPIPDE